MEPHQRRFSQGSTAFARQTPISFGLRPAKDHSGPQHVRRRERGQRHGAVGVRGTRHAAQAVQEVPTQLVKTQMAKSALDAGWARLKTMWEYKSHQAGVVFEVVNESHSTQTCSCCGAIPASGHKDRAGLGIREWICSECGTAHDRDINAAKNILAAGHRRLAAGITVSSGR